MSPRVKLWLVSFVSASLGAAITFAVLRIDLRTGLFGQRRIADRVARMEDEAWPPQSRPRDAVDAGAPEPEAPSPPPTTSHVPLPPLPPEGPESRARNGYDEGLHYIEAVYGDAGFDDPLPVLLVLHGRGSRAQLPGGPFEGLTHPVRILVPQAPDPVGRGWQWLPVRVGSGLLDRLAASLVATGGRLARFLRHVQATRSTLGKPIVTGFSQGGIVTYGLAFYHDDVVGTALPVAAWLPPALEPAYRRSDIRYPPIHALHGVDDRTVPIGPTRELFERLQALGFDAELVEFPDVGHETTPEMNAIFHAWLDEAVCEVVGDAACARDAEAEARALRGLPPIDAGVDASSTDASLDGPVTDALDGDAGAPNDAGR